MKRHLYIFLEGLAVLVPIAVTIYVVYKCVSWIDVGMRNLLGGNVFPGLGFLAMIVIIYLVGLTVRSWFTKMIIRSLSKFLERLPVIKMIYDSVKDMLKFFVGDKKEKKGVVKIPVGDGKSYMMGIVMQKPTDKKEQIPVYLPMSYALGGFLVYISPDKVEHVAMDAEIAMKLILTAGASSPEEKPKK